MTTYTITAVEFHRNGVGGRGFFNVALTMTSDGWHDPDGDGIKTHELLAIIPSDVFEDDETNPLTPERIRKGFSEVFVVQPDDFRNNWRGDVIGHAIIPALWGHISKVAFPTLYPDAQTVLPIVVNE